MYSNHKDKNYSTCVSQSMSLSPEESKAIIELFHDLAGENESPAGRILLEERWTGILEELIGYCNEHVFKNFQLRLVLEDNKSDNDPKILFEILNTLVPGYYCERCNIDQKWHGITKEVLVE
jgi:hypothetical protein